MVCVIVFISLIYFVWIGDCLWAVDFLVILQCGVYGFVLISYMTCYYNILILWPCSCLDTYIFGTYDQI